VFYGECVFLLVFLFLLMVVGVLGLGGGRWVLFGFFLFFRGNGVVFFLVLACVGWVWGGGLDVCWRGYLFGGSGVLGWFLDVLLLVVFYDCGWFFDVVGFAL